MFFFTAVAYYYRLNIRRSRPPKQPKNRWQKQQSEHADEAAGISDELFYVFRTVAPSAVETFLIIALALLEDSWQLIGALQLVEALLLI